VEVVLIRARRGGDILAGCGIRGMCCYGRRLIYLIVVVLLESDKLNDVLVGCGLFRLLIILNLLLTCGFLICVFSRGMM
jgi:hypothetical protein